MALKLTIVLAMSIFNIFYSQIIAEKPLGDGTEGDPYRISSLENLWWLSEKTDETPQPVPEFLAHYIQTNDIDATATRDAGGIRQIGKFRHTFRGKYDGQEHSITGLFLNRQQGFFGWTTRATIKNLTLIDIELVGKGSEVGAVVGRYQGILMKNVHVKNGIIS